jgi:ribosome-associated protein
VSDDLRVNRSVTIPSSELDFTFTPSGGPGGQHANKVATRVEVRWNVDRSTVLGPRQRERIRSKLRHRIDARGNLRLASDAQRSQLRNREDVRRRLARLVADALVPPKKRVDTKPSRSAVEKRLQEKKRRGALKKQRRATSTD